MGSRHVPLNELEFFAKFEAGLKFQIDDQVSVSRILIGACAAVGLEMHAMLAREAQLKMPRLVA